MSQCNGQSDAAKIRPEQLTALALAQLAGEEKEALEREAAREPARQLVAETRRLAEAVRAAASGDEAPERSPQLRTAILVALDEGKRANEPVEVARRPRWRRPIVVAALAGAAAALLAAIVILPGVQASRDVTRNAKSVNMRLSEPLALQNHHDTSASSRVWSAPEEGAQTSAEYPEGTHFELQPLDEVTSKTIYPPIAETRAQPITGPVPSTPHSIDPKQLQNQRSPVAASELIPTIDPPDVTTLAANSESPSVGLDIGQAGRSAMTIRGPLNMAPAGPSSHTHSRKGSDEGWFEFVEQSRRVPANLTESLETQLEKVTDSRERLYGNRATREQYEPTIENLFLSPTQHPLSTFSIDVDTASYSNVRRFLLEGRLPPPAAVRVEELVNYFKYSFPQPKAGEPFSVTMETTQCPWQPEHLLLRVGLKGQEIHRTERPPSNLVFLLDVSGSMADQNKLPLLKTAFSQMVAELTENDRVSIVTYAGEAGLRLPPTRADQKRRILDAIESLSAGGSTNGSAGIELAYEQAGQYFLKEGANRVILATDGDLNVGVTSDSALVELIKSKAAAGTFLTVLGFGEGNLQDAKLEKLADNGNGLYAYIDSVREARKVLVEQLSGSTVVIAKDVKVQIEFNPRQIASYRLLGYENRILAAKDFSDDTKDAGEIGAGHTMTVLYELVPAGTKQAVAAVSGTEPLKYQGTKDRGQGTEASGRREPPAGAQLTDAAQSGELLTLKLRYKEPAGQASKLLEFPLKDHGGSFNAASRDLQFAAAVASFGMILRGSEHKGSGNLAAVGEIASGALGEDAGGYRAEFVDLVRRAQSLGAK